MATPTLNGPFYLPEVVPSTSSSSPTSTSTDSASAATTSPATFQVSSTIILRIGLSFIGVVAIVVIGAFFLKVHRARKEARQRNVPVPTISDVFFSGFSYDAMGGRSPFGAGGSVGWMDADLQPYLRRLRREREEMEEEEKKVAPKMWEYVIGEEEGKTGLEVAGWGEKRSVDEKVKDEEGNLPIMLCVPTLNTVMPNPNSKFPDITPPSDIQSLSSLTATFLIALPDSSTSIPSPKNNSTQSASADDKRRNAWMEREELPSLCFGLLDLDVVQPTSTATDAAMSSAPPGSGSEAAVKNTGKEGLTKRAAGVDRSLERDLISR